ncbi:PLP-dependent transferase [Polychaeton citri CBS 116435]|uniref:PLP-dependent transferase n=1 Tax=Polychaeton citri CBS 116435 TaxID=1314669 RepID=A0A9P4Q0Y5_9PEZI|nr:PLP-dependent transferase [Polychaeton citri CBS 116435]
MRQVPAALWPKLKALQIYGANTGVGKTIVSSILCQAFRRKIDRVHYIKPVSTGPLGDADDRHINLHVGQRGSQIQSRCLFQFSDPVSPHLAAATAHLSDKSIQIALYDELNSYAKAGEDAVAIVETAGGVLSPTPSGSSQADLYRPLRLPILLVGDFKLGGIGTTISAYESLRLRGYDVHSVALFNDAETDIRDADELKYGNYEYLAKYFDHSTRVVPIKPPPARLQDAEADARAMVEYYHDQSSRPEMNEFVDDFVSHHTERIRNLQEMPKRATNAIWHPFMQHTERSEHTLVAMDSAYGDYFQTWTTKDHTERGQRQSENLLKPAFDASASWWTQGLGHGNPDLAITAAHAAGKYGHVMFASAIHEPALQLAETLTAEMGNPRLTKVFYTDNGSTGMEVAVKMGLRAASQRYGWSPQDGIEICGLKGSYHGDTVGTMDCSEPSIYNSKVEWYKGRGHWLDFPDVKMKKGKWEVEMPGHVGMLSDGEQKSLQFESLDAVFDIEERLQSPEKQRYVAYIDHELKKVKEQRRKLGALIMEPVILGAGGMMLADPLFQRCLVDYVRGETDFTNSVDWQGMPVIFDEVFTGLYRLGRFSAASFLGVDPDIVVNAKLLTGGLLPLCTTTASEAIFEAFLSSDKSDALLHGHSYTAHAVGCAVANRSLETMQQLAEDKNGAWQGYRDDWSVSRNESTPNLSITASNQRTWSMWSRSFVTEVSNKQNVASVFALGSVMAISVKDPGGEGYASTAAIGVRDTLFANVDEGSGALVHSRVLGNILYLMAAVTSEEEVLRSVEKAVLKALS